MQGLAAYVDESGSRSGTGEGGDYFVLGCIVGSPDSLGDLSERIRRLKLELVPNADPMNWELHAVEIMHERGNGILGHMNMKQKLSIMRRIVDVVCDCDVYLFEVVINSAELHRKHAKESKITRYAMARLMDLLEKFVEGQGLSATCRIVSDNTLEKHRLAMKHALDQHVRRLTSSGGGASRLAGIEFIDSKSDAIIQAVDTIAYSVRRHEGGDTRFRELREAIRRKTRRCKRGGRPRMRPG